MTPDPHPGVLYVVGVGGMFLLLIAPHEGGHFLFAKLFKVRVIEFSIGAGTRLWSVTKGRNDLRLARVSRSSATCGWVAWRRVTSRPRTASTRGRHGSGS